MNAVVPALCAAILAIPAVTWAQAVAAPVPEPRIERLVAEDQGVRIDELRVRGVTERITVRSKVAGARPYEIVTGEGGRDPSQTDGRAAGQRVWSVLKF
jgi:hypothetical protein